MFNSYILRSSRQVANHANHIARQGERIDPNAAVAVMKKTQQVKETLKKGAEDAKRVSVEESSVEMLAPKSKVAPHLPLRLSTQKMKCGVPYVRASHEPTSNLNHSEPIPLVVMLPYH
ncbi:hypothetical protein K7432_015230 [Basidiobolus ranarum]|uniref:Uncharacterized protein n=1 Tax=Basidiobolus ranarum TaxID=34480 RepID=A0ABR2VND7_9FUNG